MRVGLIDYGAGNLASVRKGLVAAGADVVTPRTPGQLDECTGIVIPGVGNFRATAAIDTEWRRAILRRIDDGVAVLGICLGMQWLFDGSDEAPGVPGLALVPGRCCRIVAERPLKVPHVGWNSLAITRNSAVLDGIPDGSQVYFTHSFAAPLNEACAASATHGGTFAAVVERGNVAGAQFHPEKSGDAGLRVLRNFVTRARS